MHAHRSASVIWVLQAIVCYIILLSFGTSLLGKGFHVLTFTYFAFAAFCQVLQFFLIIAALLLPLRAFKIVRQRFWLLSSVGLSLANIFLFFDRLVFAQMGFHFNGIVLSVLTSVGGIESLALAWHDYLALAGIVGAVIALSAAIAFAAGHNGFKVRIRRLRNKSLAVLIGCLIISDKLFFAASDVFGMNHFNAVTRAIPFYQSTHVRRLAARYFPDLVSLPKAPRENADLSTRAFSGSSLHYPLINPVENQKPLPHRYNIVWVVLDSLRYDLVTAELMPQLYRFATKHTSFTEHYSGGNNTRMGMFTLFYGLDGYHWHDILREHLSPYLLDRLSGQHYDQQIFSSTPLSFPEFRQTIFVNTKTGIHDQLPGSESWERDDAMVNSYAEFLNRRTADAQPYFALLFFDGTHTKYGFPAAAAKYRPYVKSYGHLESKKPDLVPKIKNRFFNAVSYADANLGKLFALLEDQHRLNDTIVMITGDHGEEFWESGNWGHFTAFSIEQTKVPMIIAAPGLAAGLRNNQTKHQDLPGTMLALLGDQVDPSLYSHGQSMLNPPELPYALSCAWYSCALMDSNGWYVFGTETATFALQDCYDANYKETVCQHDQLPKRNETIISLLRAMARFR